MLAAVAHEQDVDLAELPPALSALSQAFVDRPRLLDRPRLPVRALNRPRDHVLEAAEGRAPLPRRLVEAEPVVGLHLRPAPGARFHHAGRVLRFRVRSGRVVG